MIVLAGVVLVIALLGIGGGFYLLFFAGPLGTALAVPNLTGGLVIAAAVALLILASSTLLDRCLAAELDRFVAGRGPSPLRDPGLTHAYGLMVLVLLPYLIYLQLFTLEIALLIGRMIWGALRTESTLWTLLLTFPAIVVIGTIVGVALGLIFLVLPPNGPANGLTLTPRENPRLWQLSRFAAETLGTQPADVIVLSAEPGIGVSSPAGLLRLFIGGKRTLFLGLPSICGLTVGELAAILTHEYGHIGHRDTQWAAFIGTLRTSLIITLATIPGPANLEAQPLLVALVAVFNPAYWTLRAFVSLFLRVTGEFSRARETLADLEAANRFGGAVFDRALLRVAANDVVFQELVADRDVPALLRQGRSIDGFVSWMQQIYREELGSRGLAQLEYRLLETGDAHTPNDLHPGLTERVAVTARVPGEGLPDDRSVEMLFDNWAATDEAVTRLYYDSLASNG